MALLQIKNVRHCANNIELSKNVRRWKDAREEKLLCRKVISTSLGCYATVAFFRSTAGRWNCLWIACSELTIWFVMVFHFCDRLINFWLFGKMYNRFGFWFYYHSVWKKGFASFPFLVLFHYNCVLRIVWKKFSMHTLRVLVVMSIVQLFFLLILIDLIVLPSKLKENNECEQQTLWCMRQNWSPKK